jgi:hypothetical protein
MEAGKIQPKGHVLPDQTVLNDIQRKHNQNIAQVTGFPESRQLSKKTAIFSQRFNIPKMGFFPVNKLISLALRIRLKRGRIYNICFKTTFLHLTYHG